MVTQSIAPETATGKTFLRLPENLSELQPTPRFFVLPQAR